MESRYEKSLEKDIKKLQKKLGELLKQEREKSIHGEIKSYTALVDIDKSTIYAGERGESNFTVSRLYTLLRGNGQTHEEIIQAFTFLIAGQNKYSEFSLSLETEQQLRLQVEAKLGTKVAKALKSDHINRIYLMLAYCDDKKTRKTDLKKFFNLDSYTKHFNFCLKTADDMNWINMTYPEKPNTQNQSYYTTEAGKEVLRLKPEGENENS